MATIRSILFVFVPLAATVATGCLPQDTRPTPASILLTTSGDDAIAQGFDTDDGWHIDFRRFVLSLGHAALGDNDACNSYSEAHYERVVDLKQAGAQKVNLIYGLGSCTMTFRLTSPGDNAIAGVGVTDGDVLFMRTPLNDRFTMGQGINGYVSGTAINGAQKKTFTWFFRQDWFYSDCVAPNANAKLSNLQLNGADALSVDILVRGEGLFNVMTEPNQPASQLLFEPMAFADTGTGNDDGDVSLDELSQVQVYSLSALGASDSSNPGADTDASVGDAGVPVVTDLQKYLYEGLFRGVLHYADAGRCYLSPSRSRL
jgi:hypothetical protein